MEKLHEIRQALQEHANAELVAAKGRYFKTGKGEYGEHTKFIGIKVPVLRALSKTYRDISLEITEVLLTSDIHEEKMLALFIMCLQFTKEKSKRDALHALYKKHIKHVNNWDLVDSSAPTLVGLHLFNKDISQLTEWAQSLHMWERRIAMVATQSFIRKNSFDATLQLATQLLRDEHDLIHKAVGWMLREVGERNVKVLEDFLEKYRRAMPRTMLRYAIEKFPEPQRKAYLA